MKHRRIFVAALIALGAAGGAFALTTLQLFEGLFGALEYRTVDYRTRSAEAERDANAGVVLVLFDSAAVREWPYLSPFPRAVLAELIDGIAASGARTIGLDVFLGRPYPLLNALDSGDTKLAAAIRRAGNVVLAAPTSGTSSRRTLQQPDPLFATHAVAVGSADLPTPFETIRDGVLAVRTEQGISPGFALALYARARHLDLDSLLTSGTREQRLAIPGLPAHITASADQAVLTVPVLFLGPPSRPGRDDGAFPAYSAHALLQLLRSGTTLPWLQDRVVLLGSGFHDSERFRTPFYDVPRTGDGELSGWTYGVEIHATLLQNLLAGRFIRPLGLPATLLLLAAAAAAVVAFIFWKGVKLGATFSALLALALGALAVALFQSTQLVLPMIAPALAIVLAFTASTSYVSVVEGREKRMIRNAFGKYLSPAVVDTLLADPGRLKLGGEKRHISILFSDLANFTSLSERLPPETLVTILNHYLDAMSTIIIEENGTLDKYMADGIMALFGAPAPLGDHALRACRSALRMRERLLLLNQDWRATYRDLPELHLRIGINTGTPVVGNIGGERRFDYTALGDAVNLASRLEPACKTYGVSILLSEETCRLAGSAIRARELDLVAVYGKQQPIHVYELLGLADSAPPAAETEKVTFFEQGLASFRARDFDLAARYFQAVLERDPADGPALLYVERCRDWISQPPPADWDFVERRQVK